MVADPTTGRQRADADVIVVGAGPAGSTAATYLARAGLDVLLLEKSTFPRPKVCGDGLTPRGVKQIIDLGIDCSEEAAGCTTAACASSAARSASSSTGPRSRRSPTSAPSARARTSTSCSSGTPRSRAPGCTKTPPSPTPSPTSAPAASSGSTGTSAGAGPAAVTFRAPLTVACDGVSARLALSVGITKRDDRPMGVAVRRYYRSPRTHDDYLESHLELWDRSDPAPQAPARLRLDLRDGRRHLQRRARDPVHQPRLRVHRLPGPAPQLVDGTPEEWGYREENAEGSVGGAALPMGFNRVPHYRPGMLLVGDAGGLVNPFNGEGIAYAMESAAIASRCAIQSLARRGPPRRRRWRATRRRCGRRSAATTASATCSPG